VVEGQLTKDRLVRQIESRLPRLARYAQRAVGVPLALGHPSWEDDPEFLVRHHVHAWGLPPPGGEAELREATARLVAQPLERERPLWEMHVLAGLAGGRTAILQKTHHCMIDGMAGAQLLDVLLDARAGPTPRLLARTLPHPATALPGAPQRLASAIGAELSARARGARDAWRALTRPQAARHAVERLRGAAFSALRLAADDVPPLPWNAPIGPRRVLAFTRLALEDVRRVRAARGGSVNDVVLATLAGGLRRFLEADGFETRGLELTALVPVSLRSAAESAQLGNRVSAMLVPLAVDPVDEVSRLAATRAATERLKSSGAWTGIDALLELVDGLPAPLVALVARRIRLRRLANVIATNVPGPREPRWLCGARVAELRPIVPICDGMGLGLAVFSYDGWLHVGLNADAERVPNLEKLERGIEEAFAALVGSV
jgi:WS/DGAT/MGAT family acyltransferase